MPDIVGVVDMDSDEPLFYYAAGHEIDPDEFLQAVGDYCDEIGVVANVQRTWLRVQPCERADFDESIELVDSPREGAVPVTAIDADVLSEAEPCDRCGRWAVAPDDIEYGNFLCPACAEEAAKGDGASGNNG